MKTPHCPKCRKPTVATHIKGFYLCRDYVRPTKFMSLLRWMPSAGVYDHLAGATGEPNVSSDTHDTEAQARAVVSRLFARGLAEMGQHYPVEGKVLFAFKCTGTATVLSEVDWASLQEQGRTEPELAAVCRDTMTKGQPA